MKKIVVNFDNRLKAEIEISGDEAKVLSVISGLGDKVDGSKVSVEVTESVNEKVAVGGEMNKIIKQEKHLNKHRIESVIERIRDSFTNSVDVYTKGSCYKFAMILKEIYPYGRILTDNSHAIFELEEGCCYDITGIVKKGRHLPLAEEGCNSVYKTLSIVSPLEGAAHEKE